MSVVVVGWCPEGIAVASDTRATNYYNELDNDYSMKILPFEKYRMFITLCGDNDFGMENFENFVENIVEEYFEQSDIEHKSLSDFATVLYGSILEIKERKNLYHEIIVAGYDILNNKEIVLLIKVNENNTGDWNLAELNGYNEAEAQQMFVEDLYDFHLYGMYVAGIDIDNIADVYEKDINSWSKRELMSRDFNSMTLEQVESICKKHVEYTIKKLGEDNNGYVPVGGSIVTHIIKNK